MKTKEKLKVSWRVKHCRQFLYVTPLKILRKNRRFWKAVLKRKPAKITIEIENDK